MKLNPIYPTAPLPEYEKPEEDSSVVDRKFLDYQDDPPPQRFTGHWEQTQEGLKFEHDQEWVEEKTN